MMEREPELESQFKLQMHQWITEQSLIGGQKMAEAERGRVDIEVEGSLSQAVVALMDETEKGNPSAFAPLLSLMNEGEVQVGKTHKARLETLYSTSNANLGEMWRMLKADGQESTAGALFNRFHIKALMYNWLRPEEQVRVDNANAPRLEMGPLALAYPETHGAPLKERPPAMPWEEARLLSFYLFGLDASFMPNYRDLVNGLRLSQNEAVRTSMAKFEDSDPDEPFPYVPSADMSERIRQQMPFMTRASAAIDFWLSPLADDGRLEHHLARLPSFKLGPDSLWRTAYAATTLGRDAMRPEVSFDQHNKATFDMHYGESPDPAQARDRREQKMLKNQEAERTRFSVALRDRLTAWQGNGGVLSDLSTLAPRAAGHLGGDDSQFELRLLRFREGP
jgi:hypothetical protein